MDEGGSDMTEYTKWAEPVTYGSSKFEVMTDELHARPVAVVNTLDDASLIASAPELLAALQAMFNEHGDFDYTIAMLGNARAAIAKATGSKS
jgi:hypothetical protein